MTRLATCIAIAALTMISPRPAAASIGDIIAAYDTVDAIEVVANQITVTGIVTGEGAPSRRTFTILGSPVTPSSGTPQQDVAASRCDRLALLAMSKPGKFQFAIVDVGSSRVGCKLIARTP